MTKHKEPKYVVGIGASAGGLEAIKAVFQNIPPKPEMAFVVVQHLSPDFKSLMGELISQHTEMKVTTARNNTIIRPNHVYLIPRKKNIVVNDGRLLITDKDPHQRLNHPIDIFMHSLGNHYAEKAIAVILSGSGTDGSRGIMTVKEQGGQVIVQDPKDAKFDGMPNAAIYTKMADGIMGAVEIGQHLTRISNSELRFDFDDSSTDSEAEVVEEILHLVRGKTNMDFTHYKKPTILRRLKKMMQFEGYNTLADYFIFLKANPDQCERLRDEFLIGVTRFFRDEEAWRYLQADVIPRLVANAGKEDLRIWSMGCSTGEEAYTTAILFEEERRLSGRDFDFKIFATDVDAQAIARAGLGQYPEAVQADLPQEYLHRYFEKGPSGYRVKKRLRERIVFAVHNAIADPPFIKMDMISCRNLMIYIKSDVQRKLLINLQFALKYEGVLFLGSSESVGELKHALVPIEDKMRVFQNRLKSKIAAPELIEMGSSRKRHRHEERKSARDLVFPRLSGIRETVDRFMLDTYVPPVLVLAQNLDVLYLKGDFRFLLQFPQDGGDFNLENMLDAKTNMLIRSGVRNVLNQGENVFMKEVDLGLSDPANYDLLFRALPLHDMPSPSVAVEFHLKGREQVDALVVEGASSHIFSDEHVHDMEVQLREMREEKAQALEELETSNEELQSSNEELLAANEELQSTNEELQSVNEELFTVNTELQERIQQMTVLNDDWENLFRTTDVGTLFLDKELRIRRFTPAIAPLFQLEMADRGRSLSSFKANFEPSNYLDQVAKTLETLESVEIEVAHLSTGKSYTMRAVPYRTSDDLIDGVVVTFNDVSAITDAKLYYKQLFENSDEILTVFDANGTILDQNRPPVDLELSQLMGEGWKSIYPKETVAFVEKRLKEVVKKGERLSYELSTTHPDG